MEAYQTDEEHKEMTNKRPNIVCLIMDDTDFANIGCYGGDVLTPNLDRIANEGMKFNQFTCSASVCTPSRYSYMSGHHPGRCTAPDFLAGNPTDDMYNIGWNVTLLENTPALGGMVSSGGYRTGFVGKWHAGRPGREMGVKDFSPDDDPYDPVVNQKLKDNQAELCAELKTTLGFDYAASIYWNNADGLVPAKLKYHNLEWITQGAVDFLDSCHDEQPFMLYMATTTYHGPSHDKSLYSDPAVTPGGILDEIPTCQPSRKSVTERIAAAGLPVDHKTVGMTWTDDAVGVLFDKLEAMGELENTVFFYTVDHNTENGKGSCYEPGVRIPFMVRWPGTVEAGSVSNTLSQNIDFVPTVLDICGIEAPGNARLDGRSLVPVFKGEANEVHDDLYFEFGYSRAVRYGNWKYIAVRYPRTTYDKMKSGELTEAPNLTNNRLQGQGCVNMVAFEHCLVADQLYNLDSDPCEKVNLADDPSYAATLKKMKDRLKAHTDTFEHPFAYDADPFHGSPEFEQCVANTKAIGTDHIPWYPNATTATRCWPPRLSR